MYPKWKYRTHPTLGFFQSTLVLNAEAEATLEADWSDDPVTTGFVTRPAAQLNASQIVPGAQLHEVVTDAQGAPLLAFIEMTNAGDLNA